MFCEMFLNTVFFYVEDLLAPRPNPRVEHLPLSAVRDCLFNVFAAALHIWRPFLLPQPEGAPHRGYTPRRVNFVERIHSCSTILRVSRVIPVQNITIPAARFLFFGGIQKIDTKAYIRVY
jgi:hypothetical protein